MNPSHIQIWLEQLLKQPNGNITAVQTLRNAIMAASVLASAALVALMGVLATASLHSMWAVMTTTGCLLISSFFSIRTIWLLAALSFQMQQAERLVVETARKITSALQCIRWAAVFLFLALVSAALGLLYLRIATLG